MSTHDDEWFYCIGGEQSWQRIRHFQDGSEPAKEWQCSNCGNWYPEFGSCVGRTQSIRKGVWSQPQCSICYPPPSGLLGACIIGFNHSNNPWKRWADRQNGNNPPKVKEGE